MGGLDTPQELLNGVDVGLVAASAAVSFSISLAHTAWGLLDPRPVKLKVPSRQPGRGAAAQQGSLAVKLPLRFAPIAGAAAASSAAAAAGRPALQALRRGVQAHVVSRRAVLLRRAAS